MVREVANKTGLLSLHRLFGARTLCSKRRAQRARHWLYGGASIIISPHRSALQNMFWCRPGTTVIELYPKGMLASLAYSHLGGVTGTLAAVLGRASRR